MAYYTWYFVTNVEVPGFKINSFGLKIVNSKYKEKQQQRAKGKKSGLLAFRNIRRSVPFPELSPKAMARVRA